MGSQHSHGTGTGSGPVRLALRHYLRELTRQRGLSIPALALPALGNIGITYVAPLVVAKLVGRIAEDGAIGIREALPYVGVFAGVLLLAEAMWRAGLHCLNRVDARGIEHLYVTGMDELFAKDASFFHDNFAGSLTKRVLSFASRFEEFVDTLTFKVVGSLAPLLFGTVVLWQLRPAAGRRPAGDDRADRRVRRAPHPAPAGAGRPARGGDRPGLGPCRRRPDEHGHRPGVRRRGARGRRTPVPGRGVQAAHAAAPGTTATCASTPWSRRCPC